MMNKLVLGLLGAFALASVTVPATAAPAVAAPLAPVVAAVFHPDAAPASVQTVQYYAPPRPHYRRPPPRHRYGHYRGRGPHRGPHYARGPYRRY